jgi:hypothetical protein
VTAQPDLFTKQDQSRLAAQMKRVKAFMGSGAWQTLAEISAATGDPESSISARLRELRTPRHGSRIVERRRRSQATFEYRLTLTEQP